MRCPTSDTPDKLPGDPRPVRSATALAAGALLAVLAAPSWAQTTYDSVGNYVYTVPANTHAIDVQVTGGEGGAGAAGANNRPVGGAGALGGHVTARIAVSPGDQILVLVGEGGAGGRPEADAGNWGGGGGRGLDNDTDGWANGGAGGTRSPAAPSVNRGGGGGTSGGQAGADGEIKTEVDVGLLRSAGAGGGGGVAGGGGGGGMGGAWNGADQGGGGGGGAGSSQVKVGSSRVLAGGGGGGGGAGASGSTTTGHGGFVPGVSVFINGGCAIGGNAGSGGASSRTLGDFHRQGGGGGGGGGGGDTGGDGGNSGDTDSGRSAEGGQGGVNCAYGDAAHPVSNVQGVLSSSNYQGTLAPGWPAGSGRSGRVVITPVLAAAEHPITEVTVPADGGNLDCTPNPVPDGQTATCTAARNPGFRLTGISGCGGTAATASPFTTGTVTAACTVTATFERDGTTAIPTLNEWMLMLLGALAAGLGATRLRRRA